MQRLWSNASSRGRCRRYDHQSWLKEMIIFLLVNTYFDRKDMFYAYQPCPTLQALQGARSPDNPTCSSSFRWCKQLLDSLKKLRMEWSRPNPAPPPPSRCRSYNYNLWQKTGPPSGRPDNVFIYVQRRDMIMCFNWKCIIISLGRKSWSYPLAEHVGSYLSIVPRIWSFKVWIVNTVWNVQRVRKCKDIGPTKRHQPKVKL